MGIKDYLNETTLHGFRYLVLSTNNAVERLAWFLTILLSFIFAGYMVFINLVDTSNNPVATSIKKVPVQQILFPAVTINSNQGSMGPYRFLRNIFNMYEFDCALSDPDCIERTAKLRSDVQPVTKLVVKETLDYALDVAFTKFDLDGNLVRDLCREDKGEKAPLWSLALGISRAYNIMYQDWDFWTIDLFQEELVDRISYRFRTPIDYFVEGITDVILKYYPDYNHTAIDDETLCIEEFMKLELEARDFGITIHHAMGYADLEKMHLGDLVAKGVHFAYYASEWVDRSSYTEGQWEFFNATRDILASVMSIKNEVSVRNFVGYLGLNQLEYNRVGGLSNTDRFECDMAKQEVRKEQPCAANSTSDCCQLEKVISYDRESVLIYMKYFVGSQDTTIKETSEISDVRSLSQYFNYSLDKKMSVNTLTSLSPSIVACKYGNGVLLRECGLFRKNFHKDGIGYTFNAKEFWNIYKKTKGNLAFYNQMVLTNEAGAVDSPQYIKANGREFSLEIYLRTEKGKDTLLTLHDPETIPNIRKEAIKLVSGSIYDISVVPSTIRTSEDGLKLSPSSRDCMATYEADDLKIFQTYSQSACLFECQLKTAIDKCHCSNWNYPVYNDSLSYCNVDNPGGGSKSCFEDKMKDPIFPENCNCPNDCSSNQYSLVPTVTPINDWDTLCSKLGRLDINEIEGHQYFDLNDFEQLNKPRDPSCQAYVKSKISLVRIFIGPRTATQVEWTARVSFSSQLASLGGITGLFSGMSIISLAELTFWIVRIMLGYVSSVANNFSKQAKFIN